MKESIQEFLGMDNYLSDLKIKVENAQPGILEFSLPLTEKVMRPGGIMNGGAIMTVLDAAGGLVAMTYGDVGNEVTINMNTNFMVGVSDGPVSVKATVTKRGKNITFSRIEMRDPKGTLCAEATGSWYVRRIDD